MELFINNYQLTLEGTNMGRPPKLDRGKKLTAQQLAMLVGSLLGDGWIELQKGAKNARVGLQLSTKDKTYFRQWCEVFEEWLEEKSKDTVFKAYQTGNPKEQLTARTLSHPEFTELHGVFRPNNVKKLVPSLSWLNAQFTEVSFVQLFMQDGSRHGLKAASGFDIHTQGFTFESTARLCILLIEKFKIDAWPTRDIKRDPNTGLVSHVFWNIYISSDSYSNVVQLLQNYGSDPDMAARKVHPAAVAPRARNNNNKVGLFYNMFSSNTQLREDVYYSLPESSILNYARQISADPNTIPIIKPQV